jgi:GH15 family glucan-1,4-alpha-glucosidase
MTFRLDCQPAFNYARDPHLTRISATGAVFDSSELSLALSSSIPFEKTARGVTCEFTLDEEQELIFVLRQVSHGADCPPALSRDEAGVSFDATIGFWRSWLSQCTYKGRWREMVERSALALKLMTFAPTGAIVAAPTCSLPESIGGGRNWDYRYTWLRDAAFTIYGLMRIGFTTEAAAFMHWIEARCAEPLPDGSLQLVYRIDGSHELPEEELTHLEGYRGSRPVRIGNGAADQLQLDVYGELLDSVYLFNKYGTPISASLWTDLRRLVNWVCDHWQEPDEGIWETRGGRQHFVYSKLMCWVAVDRGLRLADKRSFPAERTRWLEVRDQIYEEIMSKGWSESRQAFVQAYGSEDLDASNLLMPLVFFSSPTDPKMIKTLEAIMRSPTKGGLVTHGLVYRYQHLPEDEMFGEEGTFNLCTFWLVEALTRAGLDVPERLHEARYLFEQMLGYANHLGLYAEEISPSGDTLGNFPQAFTHLALISAAFNLDRALDGR